MRLKNKLIFACVLLMFSVTAMADSISPTSVSATLIEGNSITVTKEVTVTAGTPTTSKVDVFFLADETGSMYSAIGSVISDASAILSSAAGLGDVAFGVGGYRDLGDAWVYRELTDLTTSQATAQTAINTWTAGGGGDYPEANLFALEEVATGTTWRDGSARILVWFGDAPGHDPRNGSTQVSATAALVANDVQVEAINVGTYDGYDPFGPGYTGLNDKGQASDIALATGGTYHDGVLPSTIVATINAAITSAFDEYTEVGLDLSLVPAGVTASYTGPATGTWDRSVTRTFTFDMTLTGDTVGTYGFPVYATVDGTWVAKEMDCIEVVPVPVPGAFLLGMLGLSVAGIKLRKRT